MTVPQRYGFPRELGAFLAVAPLVVGVPCQTALVVMGVSEDR